VHVIKKICCIGFVSFLYFFNLLYCKNKVVSDLSTIKSDFILETKRIQIPGYPYAFNPSIIRWGDSFLMTFRIHVYKANANKSIGLIWLDKDFNVKSKPYILEIRNQKKNNFFVHKYARITEQDPRLTIFNNRLYMVYNNFQIGRMFIAEVHYDEDSIFLDNPECLLEFEGGSAKRIEKNWVPFQYEDKLLLAYTISPHKIFLPISGTESCETFSYSKKNIPWEWGQIRGGTPAFMVDGRFLSFFHSSKKMRSNYSKGKKMPHYFIGAYTFEPHPPFTITRVSRFPIGCDDFYNGEDYLNRTCKPLRVVFPMGFVFDDNYIWISYGKQDNECWIAKLDKKRLFRSLMPIMSY
jgi:predicted GH43/DUF377 family glycosyl hydrolase